MYTRRQTALLLLLACAAATQTLAARSLQQDDIPRVVKGLKRKYGSAEAYFAQLDQDEPGTLDSIIDTNFPAGRTKLAKELNRNADMVRHGASSHAAIVGRKRRISTRLALPVLDSLAICR